MGCATLAAMRCHGFFAVWALACASALSAQPDWNVVPTNASGSFLGTITWNGSPVGQQSWVGAFDTDGNCAGSAQVILNAGSSYINLPIYGDDGTTAEVDEGITGTEAFTLRLWTMGAEIEYTDGGEAPVEFEGWANANGAPIPAFADAGVTYNFASDQTLSLTCPSAPLCLLADPVQLFGLPAGGTFSGPGVLADYFDPLAAGLGTHAVVYEFGGSSVSCEFVVVDPPSAEITSTTEFCAGDAPSGLQAVTAGGVFSGPGVFGSVFDPTVVMPGTVWVDYVVAEGGCEASSSTPFTVFPSPIVPVLVLQSDGVILASGATFGDISWFVDGVERPEFAGLSEIPAPAEFETVSVTVANDYGCEASSEPLLPAGVGDSDGHVRGVHGALFNSLGQSVSRGSGLVKSGVLMLELDK